MKFGQLIEYNEKKIFFINHAENEAERLVPDIFSFFKMALFKVKANGLQLGFTTFRLPLN